MFHNLTGRTPRESTVDKTLQLRYSTFNRFMKLEFPANSEEPANSHMNDDFGANLEDLSKPIVLYQNRSAFLSHRVSDRTLKFALAYFVLFLIGLPFLLIVFVHNDIQTSIQCALLYFLGFPLYLYGLFTFIRLRTRNAILQDLTPVLQLDRRGIRIHIADSDLYKLDLIPWSSISEVKICSAFGCHQVGIEVPNLSEYALDWKTSASLMVQIPLRRLLGLPPLLMAEHLFSLPADDVVSLLNTHLLTDKSISTSGDSDN